MSRKPLSKLAEELRATIKAIGPCTGLEAWEEISSRIARSRALNVPAMAPDIGDVVVRYDLAKLPWIPREQLDEALLEAETAGGLGCRNAHRSGADEEYSWRPLPPAAPVERQATLFG